MNKREKLLALNPNLRNGSVVAEEFDALIVGRRTTDKEGQGTTLKFTETTNPREGSGVAKQNYFRVSFKKAGETIQSAVNAGEEAFKGSHKATPGNVFANTQTEQYNWMKRKLLAKEYTEVGEIEVDGKKRPIVRLHGTIFGAHIKMNVPTYEIHTRVNGGKPKKLIATKYNPKTDKYEKTPATSSVVRFFADIEDLEELENLMVRQYERNAENYETGESIVTTSKGDTITQKVVETPIVDDLPDEDELSSSEEEDDDAGNP